MPVLRGGSGLSSGLLLLLTKAKRHSRLRKAVRVQVGLVVRQGRGRQFGRHDVETKKFVQKNDGERAALFLALSDARVIGMTEYDIEGHHQHSHCCSLAISVTQSFRGQGIGSRLIAAGEEWCKSKSIKRLDFEVIEGNPAVAFYQRLGFEIEGRKRKAVKVGNEFRDLIIMAKLLA